MRNNMFGVEFGKGCCGGWYAVCLTYVAVLLYSVEGSLQVDVSGLVGNTVRLPCHVDTKTCGNLHSIKWYRGSSRIFVFSDLAKFSKSEGDYESRANISYIEHDTTSYLVVRGLKTNDEAVYKCEITYLDVVESCVVVQFINLTTLIAPSHLEITVDDSYEKITERKTIGAFNEGSILNLTCEVGQGKPVPTLRWFKNNQEISDDYSSDSGGNVIGGAQIKKQIKLSRNDLGAVYECRASSQALNQSLSVPVEILVNVKPSKMELTGFNGAVDQNTTVDLHCAVYGARPAAVLTWYNGSRRLEEKENNISKKSTPAKDGTLDTISRLTFIASRFEHVKTFRCIARNDVMKDEDVQEFEKTQIIEVNFAPIITILPEQTTVNETADVYINCSYEANPFSIKQRFWFFNGARMLPNKTTHEFRDNSLLLKKVNRNFLGKYFCTLENAVGSSNSTEAELNVLYPPTVYVHADAVTTVNESAKSNVSLFCRVLYGNPTNLTNVQWYFNGEPVRRYANVSNLILKAVQRGSDGNYSCVGRNDAGWGPRSVPVEVVVQYQPGLANLSYQVEYPNGTRYEKDNVLKGSTVYLVCNLSNLGRPEATKYHWYAGTQELLKDSQNNVLALTNVGAKDELTNYSCNAENAAGFGTNASISINVVAPPSFIHAEKYVAVTKENRTADLKCTIECDPMCDVSWKKNDMIIYPDEIYEIENKKVPADAGKNDFESIVSTLRINLFKLADGHVEPKRDDATYTCESTGNSVGPGVRNSIDFQVHFAPVNVSVRQQIIDVTDNRIPPRVTCSAVGRPDPLFRWYNGSENETFSSDATLSFNTGLSRNASTNFTCEAYNSHGSATKMVYFNILYKPKCSIEQFHNEGKVLLICKAVGNPPPVSYNWTTDEGEVAEARMDEKGSNLEIEPPATAKIYNCTATNVIDTSDVCFVVVGASDDWWLWRIIKSSELPALVLVIIAVAIILIVIIVCVLIILVCRKKRAKEKCPSDLVGKNKNNYHSPNDALLQPETDKAFYENLPFHGMQNPPNKPFRPEFTDLDYADVDYRSYGPINYKAASIYEAQKRNNESETESEDYLL